jgi:hypothetical protein
MVYFTAIWYILWSFGIFFPVLVCCAEKNLATLRCRKNLIFYSFETWTVSDFVANYTHNKTKLIIVPKYPRNRNLEAIYLHVSKVSINVRQKILILIR